ncbi:Aldehyde dehydrogenase, partial [Diplonema papillatum]
ILDNTQSGNVCINTCLEHYMNQNLPFGGTGSSGIGKVHGYYGFAEMSHKRGCLKQDTFIKKTAAMGRPPLNDKAYNTLIKVLMTGFIPRRVRPTFRIVTMMLLLFVLYRFVNKLIPTSL